MSEDILIPEIVTSTPYEDHEQPSIRFDVKEDEETTKHLFFYKTNKKKSFLDSLIHLFTAFGISVEFLFTRVPSTSSNKK